MRGYCIVQNHDCLTNVEMADAPEVMGEKTRAIKIKNKQHERERGREREN